MTRGEAAIALEVITAKVLLHQLEVYVLIDHGSTHSFISSRMTSHMHIKHDTLDLRVNVHTPIGEVLVVEKVYRDRLIKMGDAELYVNLIILPFLEFDIILGMDWLSRHHAKVDCYTKEIIIDSPGQTRVMFCGDLQMVQSCLISTISVFKMIRKGCEAYLAHLVDMTSNSGKFEDIPVVKEFQYIFLEYLSGMPPDRDIEFSIEVALDTTPIFNAPYRMAPVELKKLKT